MNRLGISLPWDYLAQTNTTDEGESLFSFFPHPRPFLGLLKEAGVSSIELRHRRLDMPRVEMIKVFTLLREEGLGLTIHSDALGPGGEEDLTAAFPWLPPYREIFPTSGSPLMVTLHPVTPSQAPRGVKTDTVLLAHHLTALIKKQAYPVILALENQRSKGDQNSGTSYQGIAEMVAAVADPGLGICWDMGHATANHLTEGQPLMPHQEFLQKTVHTHIHDLSRQGKTHWPLKENQVPVEDFVTALKKNGYRGLYNLELSFSRFRREKDREKSIFDSISRLSLMIKSPGTVE